MTLKNQVGEQVHLGAPAKAANAAKAAKAANAQGTNKSDTFYY